MKYVWLSVIMLGIALAVGGCVENGPAGGTGASAKARCKAECLVCKYNADLACVDIDVDASTPRTTVGGKDYFFCSDSCKHEFEKTPAKFAGR